jgi:hypothetical protein
MLFYAKLHKILAVHLCLQLTRARNQQIPLKKITQAIKINDYLDDFLHAQLLTDFCHSSVTCLAIKLTFFVLNNRVPHDSLFDA